MKAVTAIQIFEGWFKRRKWKIFPFQREVFEAYTAGQSGLLNAPTGSGKTYAVWLPVICEAAQRREKKATGLRCLWITPVRSLARDVRTAMQTACDEINLPWQVAIRTGDTSAAEKQKQKKALPQGLVITPESLHILLSQKGYEKLFEQLETVVVDEWHELLGNKRGTQVELALSRLKALRPEIRIWGISATIGNMEEARTVLLGKDSSRHAMIKAGEQKKITVTTILPDKIDNFPWAGHLGVKLLQKAVPVIEASRTTLIFTNTRAQAEIWYQQLLEVAPQLAGQLALHHGSLSTEIRNWVEDALHAGILKAVVCTSSLDLGVDFRPVDTVIQIGGPKGVARFLQRAGRSGHQPGAESKIWFLPAHALELMEASALRTAAQSGRIEARVPVLRAWDVLAQYLVTLAVGSGFNASSILAEVRTTHAFAEMTDDEWNRVMEFIISGGPSLKAYSEYAKVVRGDDGNYYVADQRIARRHRFSIGTILSSGMLTVKFISGGYIGSVEEYFIAQLKPGDTFYFSGRTLELVMIKDMKVLVRASKAKKALVPQYMGGRMPLSSQLSELMREKMTQIHRGIAEDEELKMLLPLFQRQNELSLLPSQNQFLIEVCVSREGQHLFFYTFDGRQVNEGLAALVAWRLSRIQPLTFSIAMNDYGFELLTDSELDWKKHINRELFSSENLIEHIQHGLNASEMASRRFRGIAQIAGLTFSGYPGNEKKTRHLQASSKLFFEVFREHEPDHLLLRQAYEEVLLEQLDEVRLRKLLNRLEHQELVVNYTTQPSPFAFPIMVERIREKLSTEKLEDRVQRMIKQLEKEATR
ncbi:MAG: ligase-associated DNA damage response DEXH box helicase [Bacteroidetes bacterium]|nr:ligase-associated DNA damage response DEXH box helicase [Bacteroidota bacterium]